MRHQTSRTSNRNAGHIFASNLEDQGPGNKASLVSLGLHSLAVLALVAIPLAPVRLNRRTPKVVMLQESRLLDPVRPAKDNMHSGGGTGGSREHVPASHGITPPPTILRAQFSPLRIPPAQPRLPVSPSLLEVAPPRIEPSLQYGNPNKETQFLSAGWGIGGFGAGAAGFGDGSSSGSTAGNADVERGGLVFSMGDVSVIPVLIYKIEPDYTEQAKRSRYQGTVLLNLVIDDQGHPQQVRVARPLGLGLDEKAVEAVRRWRFRPAIRNGKTVAVAANIEVNFELF